MELLIKLLAFLAFVVAVSDGFANTARPKALSDGGKLSSCPLSMTRDEQYANTNISRSGFVSRSLTKYITILSPSIILPIGTRTTNAFDGGVGGLGKTRPQTGVVFRDPESVGASSTNELLAPDGSPAFVTFSSPWPQLKTSTGIEARDVAGGFESAFVQVAELPKGVTSVDDVKPSYFSDVIFSSSGKFGMYGVPTDVKIKKVSPSSSNESGTAIYLATFTTLTPAMRESDRKAYISASKVGNGLFLLVTSTTTPRFNKLESTLRNVADSFTSIPAPKSSLRKSL